MFSKTISNNSKTMKSILIPAVLLFILTVLGCGNSDNMLSPNEEVLAAPSKEILCKHKEGWIGPEGGIIHAHGNTKVIIPEGALDDDVYITVDIEIYKVEKKIHFIFGPHDTVFNMPVQIEMSWSHLDDDEPPQLWSLDDDLEWVLVEDAIIEKTKNRCIVYVNHFSEYYFLRR